MSFSSIQRSSPIVLNLVIINVIVFVAQNVFGETQVNNLFALHHYKADVFQPYQMVTHMFMHGGIFHILFNMFALWMFGSLMERIWGPKRFLSFYLVCGLFAAIAQMISYAVAFWGVDHAALTAAEQIQYQDILTKSATVGASGAIMGVLAAYAYTFPNTELFIMPIPFPIKAKWAIIGIIGIDLFGGFANASNDNVAHFAHVGGALAGLAIVWYWNRNNKKQFF
jgi:hypothetical protein